MSKDIRSFFKVHTKSKLHSDKNNISDDDVIPESPDVQIKVKKKENKKRRVLNDSSDEEIFSKKSKSEHNKQKTPKGKNKKGDKPKLLEVKASDIFGSTPIKRTAPVIKKEVWKSNTETGIHSDEEFELSLLELDDKSTNKDTKSVKVNDVVIKNESSGSDKTNINITIEKTTPEKIKVTNGDDRNKSNTKSVKKEKTKTANDTTLKKPDEKGKTPKEIKENIRNENKRDFAEFIDDSQERTEECGVEVKNKKRKLNKSLNETIISDEERYEKKRFSAVLYQNYLNRSGPKNLGSKQIPEGRPECLKDCAFLLTGVLDSFEREEISAAINKYGGTIKSGISKKVTHVLAGEEAGPAKLAKAQDLNIKIINEDEFLQLIIDRTNEKKHSIDKVKKDRHSKHRTEDKNGESEAKEKATESNNKIKDLEEKIQKNFYSKKTKEKNIDNIKKAEPQKSENKLHDDIPKDRKNTRTTLEEKGSNVSNESSLDPNMLMWVDKYKPQTLKQVIGQHGDASSAKKLSHWLTRWYLNRKEKIQKPNPWAKNDDGAYFKAALLSGPPGVGKTTTVSLVCKELGFDMVEFNASDTRSKNLIKEQITELLTTSSLSGFAKGETGKKAVSKKHVLVMDEVDGMAGNEDRGGLQELIALIKISAVPIICMCNDRTSQKMRSLVNYCFDLKFNKPRVDQIKSAMLSICFKENVKIQPDALTRLIMAANQDVRQTLHLLSMWSVNSKHMDSEQVKKDAGNVKRDMKLGPWEAVRKVFSAEEHKTMSINDKSDLFFYDYSIAPLFVQENYLIVAPHCPKKDVLSRISMAADSISMGDLVEAKVRGRGAWNLLPLQAMYSSVIPGHAMAGHVAGQIQFPGWLGKNSRKSKMQRLCQEIHAHTRLSTSGSKSSIYMDYSKHLRDAVTSPLIKANTQSKEEGIASAMAVLQSYHLLREDLDSLVELSLWPGQKDPMILVNSTIKAALTREYNKKSSALPYAPGAVKRGRARADAEEGVAEEGVADERGDEPASDSDPDNDALIKKKKRPAEKKANPEKPSTSKDKGKKGKNKKS